MARKTLWERIAESLGFWPVGIDAPLPEGVAEEDVRGPVANPMHTHYSAIWKVLDPRFGDPSDEKLGRYGMGQLPPREGAKPFGRGEWHGWSGPAVGVDAQGDYIFADYGTLDIAVVDVPGTAADEAAEDEYRVKLRDVCDRWPDLIRQYAGEGDFGERLLEGLAEKLRYFKRELFTDRTLEFIDSYPAHRVPEDPTGEVEL